MLGKADKTLQNSALQGISEQENFMIRVLFICHGNILKSLEKACKINRFTKQIGTYYTIFSVRALNDKIVNGKI